ncbi:MAG TPA: DoxX family protein [Gemmatimonadales bacterium]|nr:DoxX family protein [Gemmatimonadales bacterium]
MSTLSADAVSPTAPSRRAVLAGRILSGLAILFMLFDTAIHFMAPAPVTAAFERLGYSASLARPIAVIELVCLILYAVPRTAPLGAVLLTGYLGGAVATQLRAGSSLFGETLFPIYVGIVVWLGLALRDERVRRALGARRSR